MTTPEPLGITPSQTVGPYLHIGLSWDNGNHAASPDTPGAIRIIGTLYDGAGNPVDDGLIETWQADPDGRFDHPDDPRGPIARPESIPGFARASTVAAGAFEIVTIKPGPVPSEDGNVQAPHLDVSVFARGLLDRTVTRLYFADDDPAHASDPVLAGVDPKRRHTLMAVPVPDAPGSYRFDIHLQGAHETVFFAL